MSSSFRDDLETTMSGPNQVNLFGITLTVGQLISLISSVLGVLCAILIWIFLNFASDNKEKNNKLESAVASNTNQVLLMKYQLDTTTRDLEFVKARVQLLESSSQTANIAFVEIRADLKYLREYIQRDREASEMNKRR